MKLVNDLPQRIYRDGRPIRSGGVFESDRQADLDRFPEAEEREEQSLGDDALAAQGQASVDVRRVARTIEHAQLRDEIDPVTGHAKRGTGLGRLNNAPSVGSPSPDLPAGIGDPNQPAPETSSDGAITTGAVGHEEQADPRTSAATTVLGEAGITQAADSLAAVEPNPGGDEQQTTGARTDDVPEGVTFASSQAEAKARESGKLADLKPGGGTGEGGAYKAGDL